MASFAHAVLLSALAASAATGVAQAQSDEAESSPTVSALLACREIIEQDQRVDCMETQLANFAEALNSGRLYVVEEEEVLEAERDTFGFAREPLIQFANRLGMGRSRTEGAEDEPEISFDDGVTAQTDSDGRLAQLDGLAVASVRSNPRGRITVYLENGQVWRQTDRINVRQVRTSHIEEGLTASIERGVLGSFFMRLSHQQTRFRAERVE